MNITGQVQNIKSTRKSLQINNLWFYSFNLLPNDINKGDTVELVYVIKKVDDKEFNNIRSIKKLESEKNIDNVTTKKDELDNTSKNNLMILAVNLYIDNKDHSIENYLKELKRLRLSL